MKQDPDLPQDYASRVKALERIPEVVRELVNHDLIHATAALTRIEATPMATVDAVAEVGADTAPWEHQRRPSPRRRANSSCTGPADGPLLTWISVSLEVPLTSTGSKSAAPIRGFPSPTSVRCSRRSGNGTHA